MDTLKYLEELERRAELGGGEARLKKQHEAGKLTARERVDLLFDPGTFQEIDKLVTHRCRDFDMEEQIIPGDGVVAGQGRVEGRPVFAFAQDFTVFGGSLSETNAAKIVKIMDQALKMGAPMVGLNDSGGARIQEGVMSLGGYADIFLRNTLASGVIPQISAIMGPCAGGAVYSPAITDFNIMVENTSYMFVTGPDVIKTVTHEEVTKEQLGGARTHNEISGVAHFSTSDDRECLRVIRELLGYLPGNNMDDPPRRETSDPVDREDEALDRLVPESPNQPYDMHDLVQAIADRTDGLVTLEPGNLYRVIKRLLARHSGLEVSRIDDVILGCANQAGEDNRNVARMSLLLAGLPVSVPGITVNRLCASGLSAVAMAAAAIRSGMLRRVNEPGPTVPRSNSSHVHGAETGAPGLGRTL